MANHLKIDAITSPLNTAAAESKYKFVTSLQKPFLPANERQMATVGLKFTAPDGIGIGYNTICMQDPTTEGNGLLHQYGQYNELGETPKRTFMLTA